jgi:hypothetical protein
MNCQEYIETFLPAHADDELVGRERRAADQHTSACVLCRARLVDDRRLKALVRIHGPMAKVPADARLQIRWALGEATHSLSTSYRTPSGGGGEAGRIRHVALRDLRRLTASVKQHGRFSLSMASIAAVGLIVVLLAGRTPSGIAVPQTAAFDLALQKFDDMAQGFVPNAPPESVRSSNDAFYAWVVDRDSARRPGNESADLARSYREADVPEEVYDFELAGYGLYGGRVDEAPDGQPMTYTVYRGEKGQILSICMHTPDLAAPVGARYWAGTHTFYEYKNHSLCLTFHPAGHFVSIMVAREPVADLLRDVSVADAASANS